MDNKPEDGPAEPLQIMKNYTFSSDELRILEQCNTESFYQRSLPLSVTFGAGTYFAIKGGYLKAGPRFGVIPKVIGAALLGYISGKFSYRNECAKKFMNLPNSQIGAQLRKRLNVADPFPSFGSGNLEIDNSAMDGRPNKTPRDSSDPNINASLNMDTDRPSFSSLDDARSNDDSINAPINLAPPQPSLSYDDLRRQNRDDHVTRRSQPYKMEDRPPITRPQAEVRNKYGDVMD